MYLNFLYVQRPRPHIRILQAAVNYIEPQGVKTLQTQDTSDPRHFDTIRLVPKCPGSSAPVPKCLADTLALVPNCLDLQQTFLLQ